MAVLRCESCRQTLRLIAPDPEQAPLCPTCGEPLHPVDPALPGALESTSLPPLVREAARDPARRFGRFVIVRDLGRGGMGTGHHGLDARPGPTGPLAVLTTGAAGS